MECMCLEVQYACMYIEVKAHNCIHTVCLLSLNELSIPLSSFVMSISMPICCCSI